MGRTGQPPLVPWPRASHPMHAPSRLPVAVDGRVRVHSRADPTVLLGPSWVSLAHTRRRVVTEPVLHARRVRKSPCPALARSGPSCSDGWTPSLEGLPHLHCGVHTPSVSVVLIQSGQAWVGNTAGSGLGLWGPLSCPDGVFEEQCLMLLMTA